MVSNTLVKDVLMELGDKTEYYTIESDNSKTLDIRLEKRSFDITYGVKVTGRQEQIGRDNMVRIWAEDYYRQIGFNHPLRQMRLLKYLNP